VNRFSYRFLICAHRNSAAWTDLIPFCLAACSFQLCEDTRDFAIPQFVVLKTFRLFAHHDEVAAEANGKKTVRLKTTLSSVFLIGLALLGHKSTLHQL
jgi:hypothetical protein